MYENVHGFVSFAALRILSFPKVEKFLRHASCLYGYVVHEAALCLRVFFANLHLWRKEFALV